MKHRLSLLALLLAAAISVLCPAPAPALALATPAPADSPAAPHAAYVFKGDLYAIATGGAPVRLTRGAAVRRPQWSTDGHWVSYFTGDELWIASADGRQVQRVAGHEAPVVQAAWSPTEPLLGYITLGRLWLTPVGPDGPGAPREAHMPASAFAFSPDGKQMVVEEPWEGPWQGSRPEHQGLVLVPVGGGPFKTLLQIPEVTSREGPDRRPAFTVRNLAFSPDGRWISFHIFSTFSASLNADGVTLAVLPTAGGEMRRVGGTLGYPDWVAWRPDSQALGYIFGGGREVWSGKAVHLAYPPYFRPGGPDGADRITPAPFSDIGLAWEPRCGPQARRKPAPRPPSDFSLATVRVGPGSPRDEWGHPLPAIFVDGQQVSRPQAPYGDQAPSWECLNGLAWVRISQAKAFVMLKGRAWVEVDPPPQYYGHWAVREVLAWWGGPRLGSR